MKSLYAMFETDTALETENGIVLDYGEAGKIRITRAGESNQRFVNYSRAKLKPYTRQMQAGTMDPKVSQEILADVYAATVIIGWDGVRGRDGNLLEFNRDNVRTILLDLPELFKDIQAAAQDASLFRKQVVDDIVGNSSQPSPGMQGTESSSNSTVL